MPAAAMATSAASSRVALRGAAQQHGPGLRGRSRPDPLLLLRIHVLLTGLFELGLRYQIKRSSKLQVETAKRVLVRRVAKVARRVERLLDAKLVIQCIVPLFLRLGNQLALPHRKNVLVVVELMRVESEELEEEFRLGRFVLATESLDLLQVIGKVADSSIWPGGLVWQLMQRW
jgi:hypothetical protein